MIRNVLAWTSFGCTIVFAALGLTAVFGSESLGVPGVPLVYAAVAVGVIGILSAIALMVVGPFEKG